MNFFGENQRSIHCTHSLQKAPALMVHHLHPLEQSRPHLKFCFENNIYNHELTLCITLSLHVNTVIEKIIIIFLISIRSVLITVIIKKFSVLVQ